MKYEIYTDAAEAESMASRGLGMAGEWVGFDKARELWGTGQ